MRIQRSPFAPAIARRLMQQLFGPPGTRTFAVRYWDGTEEHPAPGTTPPFTLVIRTPGALRRMLLPPSELAVTEAYLRDDFDVEGDLEQVLVLATALQTAIGSTPARLAGLVLLAALLPAGARTPPLPARLPAGEARDRGTRHSPARDARSVRAHYDAGNEFYRIWLDRHLVYSCAYFPTGTEDLDTAQEAKLEHICRKLRLRPGESLLDIGCGWGGLALYAAAHYGVRATGITLSAAQASLARERAQEAELQDRVTFEVRDYRDLRSGACFDKVASIGMLEHVGREQMDAYFAAALRVTRPGGLFLAHGIVDQAPVEQGGRLAHAARRLWGEGRFIDRYVFPDGELLRPWELAHAADHAGWELRDAENLREHYALTLRHWVRRLEAGHAAVVAAADETTYRVWRLYMSASAYSFATGKLGVVQYLLSSRLPDGIGHVPLTRADLYR